MRRLLAGIAAAAVIFLTAPPASAATHDVSITNFAFTPATLTIPVNDVVKWTNNAVATAHNVYSDETQQLRSAENIAPGNTYTFTFGAPGTYNYYCTIHGKEAMSGQVIVQAPTTTTRTVTTILPRPTTTRSAVTTTRATVTSTTESTTTTLAEETTTTEDTTTTTSGDIAITTDDDGGTNGLAVGALVVGILAVLGGGGYALYRIRTGA